MADKITQAEGGQALTLVYDGDCPICRTYTRALDTGACPLDKVDARQDSNAVQKATDANMDLDEGVVVEKNGELYHGADAIHQLALVTSNRGVLNRTMRWLFRSESRARRLYPFFRGLRNGLLRVLGKERIGNLKD